MNNLLLTRCKHSKPTKKFSKSQPHAEGLSEGTSVSPSFPDESTIILTTLSEGTGTKPRAPDEVQGSFKAKADITLDWGLEEDSEYSEKENVDEEIDWVYFDEEEEKKDDADDDKSIDLKETDNEETKDEFVHSDEYVNDDVDEEMKDVEVAETRKGDEEITDTIPHIQSKSILIVHVLVISDPTVLSPIPEIPIDAPAITLPPPPSVTTITYVLQQTTKPISTPPITTIASAVTTVPDPLPAIVQRVSIIEKDVQELKEDDHTTTLLASLRSKIPLAQYSQQVDYKEVIEESVQANVINEVKNLLPKFLPKAVSDFATLVIQSTVKKALEKTLIVLAQSSSQAQSFLKAAESLYKYELKTILFEKIGKSRSYLTHDKHQALFDALLNSMCLDDVVARGQVDPGKILRKRDRDDDNKDEDPSAGPNQDKSPAKTSKSSKSVTAKELVVKEPAFEMAFDDIEQTVNDVVNDVHQSPNDETQTKDKASYNDWFIQPPRPPNPDLEWNTVQEVNDAQEQPWFNDLLSAEKDPLTFDKLIATPIDFSKFAMNRLKIDKLTNAHLVRPVYKLLKSTCQSSIEHEYNMEECYKALSDQLDWNNPEGDRCPFDLSKPLPLKAHPGRLTIPLEYFFNNDLEYLKSSDLENKYTTSIMKTKAARYKLVGDPKCGQCEGGKTTRLWLLEGDCEDMLLLIAQHKLFNLEGSDIVDLVVALYCCVIDNLQGVINMVCERGDSRKHKSRRNEEENWMNTPVTFPPVLADDVSDEPLIIEVEVEGYLVQRVFVDHRAAVQVMFEHCFDNLPTPVKARLTLTQTELVGFFGEQLIPIGKVEL
ncbi:hypothetical protein Tco_1110620 [Tanacetum coccineum]|uniref:Uncharacterized protein n=1 Tax=Tanacetum coccineum TaxID=301880 RepID=A0ABQ5IJD5_9ASTR